MVVDFTWWILLLIIWKLNSQANQMDESHRWHEEKLLFANLRNGKYLGATLNNYARQSLFGSKSSNTANKVNKY